MDYKDLHFEILNLVLRVIHLSCIIAFAINILVVKALLAERSIALFVEQQLILMRLKKL